MMPPTDLHLSHWNSEEKVVVPKSIVKDLKSYHCMGIRFLYDCYRKKLKGAILNQDDEMNFPIQVSAFLNAIYSTVVDNIRILILTRETSILAWHYHLVKHGGFTVRLLTETNADTINNLEDKSVILVDLSDLKLLDHIVEITFFVTVIDDLDTVAQKLIIKKVKGSFNIGLTCRNFLMDPDLKMQWKMLNWSNPDIAGKQNDFYENGYDDEFNLCNPYRCCWLRISWHFTEEIEKETVEEKYDYLKELKSWAEKHNLEHNIIKNNRKRKHNDQKPKYGKKQSTIFQNSSDTDSSDVEIKLDNNTTKKSDNTNNNSSEDTIIYEEEQDDDKPYVKLPSMDESPILTSIINSLECSNYENLKKDKVVPCSSKSAVPFYDGPSTSKFPDNSSYDDILTSPIKNESESENTEEDILSKYF